MTPVTTLVIVSSHFMVLESHAMLSLTPRQADIQRLEQALFWSLRAAATGMREVK